jgi:capsular polysaccharide biosynthesis protein
MGEPNGLGALLRRGWIAVAVAIILGVIGGVVLTKLQQPRYTASASVLVTATGVSDSANLANSRTLGTINLDTEAQLARSTQVADRVREEDPLRKSIPTQQLLSNLSVSVPANTSVLRLSYTSDSATAAAQLANDFANAYLGVRGDNAQATLDAQVKKVSTNVKALTTTLSSITRTLSSLSANSKIRSYTQAQKSLLVAQLTNLNTQYNQLSATVVTPGQVLSKAIVPSVPTSPSLMLNVAAGLALGLLAGLLVAWLRFAKLRRMSRPDDVSRLIHVPVAGTVDRLQPMQLEAAGSSAGVEYQRVANLLAASIGKEGVILVTGAAAESPTDTVAINIASALSRSAVSVSYLPLTGATDTPTGKLGAIRVIEPDASLAVVGAITRNRLDQIRRGGYLIVAVPDAGASADAQTLATLSDAVLIVIAARTKVHDGRNAVDQLDAVGAPVLGAVLVPAPRASRRLKGIGARGESGATGPAKTVTIPEPVGKATPATEAAAAPTLPTVTAAVRENGVNGVAHQNGAGGRHQATRPITTAAGTAEEADDQEAETVSGSALVRARSRARVDRMRGR